MKSTSACGCCRHQHQLTAVNMNPQMAQGVESVRVGVVFTTPAADNQCAAICEGGRRVDYTPVEDEPAKSFPFDHAADVDNIKSLQQELLQPLPDFIITGYNVALLICGASSEPIASLMDCVIRQLFQSLFSSVTSKGKEELFTSVSCLQFPPDRSSVDLLSLQKRAVELVTPPGLGCCVAGLCEVCVSSAEEACTLYEMCMKNIAASRCSSLFSVNVEWKLDPGELESDVCRSFLQLFNLVGGASRADLRGVNPLLKLLDQIPNSASTSRHSLNLHQSLLKEALTGNSKTVLIYCIDPQGVAGDETHCALKLSQAVKALTTKPSVGRWSPRAVEREIREHIRDLRCRMMSCGEDESSVHRLGELSDNLQVVKNQSWGKRREESERIKDKMKSQTSVNRNQLFLDVAHVDQTETDTVKSLHDQLRQEMEEHIREGRADVEQVQRRIGRIQQLKETLKEENNEAAPLSQQLDYNKARERRKRLKEHHGRLLAEEAEKMEKDLALDQLPTDGPHRELLLLSRERQVLVLHIEALRDEAQLAERDLEDQQHRHQTELQCVREESLQVFRVFREASEQQRKLSESRYRSVLLEAVQDAIYLSAQNQQLQADNKQLRKALGELKDAVTVGVEPMVDLMPTQQ